MSHIESKLLSWVPAHEHHVLLEMQPQQFVTSLSHGNMAWLSNATLQGKEPPSLGNLFGLLGWSGVTVLWMLTYKEGAPVQQTNTKLWFICQLHCVNNLWTSTSWRSREIIIKHMVISVLIYTEDQALACQGSVSMGVLPTCCQAAGHSVLWLAVMWNTWFQLEGRVLSSTAWWLCYVLFCYCAR